MTKHRKTLLIMTLPIKLINVALPIMDFVTMTNPYRDFTYNGLTYNINNVALRIMDFTCN
jgi:hypothetical protein